MISRPYTPYDYALINSWHLERGLPCPPAHLLPSTGLLVFKDETPVACAFMYRTDSSLALLDGLCSSPMKTTLPEIAKVIRREAMSLLLEELSTIAKNEGYAVLMAAPTHPNVGPFLKEHGFTLDPAPTQIFVRSLIG